MLIDYLNHNPDLPQNTLKKRLCFLAISMGLFASLYPGSFFGLCGLSILLLYLHQISRFWNDRWPFRLFLIGFIPRLLIISLLYFYSPPSAYKVTMFGDSDFNFWMSEQAFYALLGNIDYRAASLSPGLYGYNILPWIYGALYLLLGYSPFLIMIINTTMSCLTAWVVFLITYKITQHRTAAAWAMGFTILSPSQILWSVNLLKEPVIELILAVIVYLFVVMIQQRKWHYLIIITILTYMLGQLRMNLHYLVLAALGLSIFLFIPRRLITGTLLIIFVLGTFIFYRKPSRMKEDYLSFQANIINTQIGNITTGGAYYKFIPDRYQPGANNSTLMDFREITFSYLKALYYYLCTPNPFKRLSLNKTPALPQMFLWYFSMIFFFFPGTLYLLRYHFRSSGVIFIFLLVFTSGLALFTGNEGTAFRQRDIVTPFFFIPIAVSLINTLGWFARRAGPLALSSANEPSKQEN